MREIKFRGWNGRKMLDVYYVTRNGIGALGNGGMIIPKDDGSGAIMQFTGLTDINGVEIYEGDIVSAVLIDKVGAKNKYVGKVFYQEYEFCIETEDHFWPVASWHCVYECEVIGNIYQNPELLK